VRLSLSGDRENIVPLMVDYSGVSKFGLTETDQDNLKLVRKNVRKLCEKAIEKCELIAIPSIIGYEGKVSMEEDALRVRLAKLKPNNA
jgi:hypothetical protein